MRIPPGCMLTDAQFHVLKRRRDFNAQAARREFSSCRAWFLMEVTGGRPLDYSIEDCLLHMARYISVTRFKKFKVENGHRSSVFAAEQPKQQMLVLATRIIREWSDESPPSDLNNPEAFLECLLMRQQLLTRAIAWGESYSRYYPRGEEGRNRFYGKTIRLFAENVLGTIREALRKLRSEIEVFRADVNDSTSTQKVLFEV